MNIKYLKLITGEEVVADVTTNMDTYTLKNPIKLVLMPPMGLSMIGFCNFIKSETVKIKHEHVMFMDELDDEIYNAYNQKFGSGIVLATNSPSIKLHT